MKLLMPQEIEVWYIIPAIRRELAKAMLRKGLAQKRIAEVLGVTEAAVSQYIKSKRASEVRFNPAVSKQIGEAAGRIASGGSVIGETQKICRMCKADLTMCELHRKYGAACECKVCL